MKKKSAIKDMLDGKKGLRGSIGLTATERELFLEIARYNYIIEKSLAVLPSILELYRKFHSLFEHFNIESTNKYYAEGFKFGLLLGMEVREK